MLATPSQALTGRWANGGLDGQLPSYEVFRPSKLGVTSVPAANVFFIPVARADGTREEGLRLERALFALYDFKLNVSGYGRN